MRFDLFDFSRANYYQPEDRWLRFALRLSLVLFVIAIEATIVVCIALLLWRS